MAHNLNLNLLTGTHAFFTVKKPAWHGLGTIVDKALNSGEAIVAAQLDYEVKTTPVLYDLKNGKDAPYTMDDELNILLMPDRKITYRDDTKEVFEVVSNDYHVVQNREAFKFFDNIVGKGEAIFETAGALGKGETIFITALLPNNIIVGNGDEIKKYLLLTTSHDGKAAINVMFTPIRVVCNNTLTMALEGKDKLSIRHSSQSGVQLEQAQALLEIVSKEATNLQEIFDAMIKHPVTDEEVREYILKCLLTAAEWTDLEKVKERKLNMLSTVYTYYFTGPGQREFIGTLYGAYNAISGYFNNVKEYRKVESRMTSNLSGDNAKIVKFAMYYAVKIMKNGK